MFVCAKFSRCLKNITTLMRDGSVALWNVDAICGKYNNETSVVNLNLEKETD